MNFTAWDTSQGSSSLVMEEKLNDAGLPGEILTLMPENSEIDLLSYLPPGAVALDTASRSLTLMTSQLFPEQTYYSFACGRTGWYWINFPFVYGDLIGVNTGTTYNVTLQVSENTGTGYINVGADSKECGSYSSFTTSLKALVHCTAGLSYDCFVFFAQNGKTYLPVPILAVGGSVNLRIPFVMPVISSISSFGVSPFVLSVSSPIVVVPEALALYDMNNYTEFSATWTSTTIGIPDASISESHNNTFYSDTSGNSYLTVWAPNVYPSPTGGILMPALLNVKTVLMWVKVDSFSNTYGQYFVDFQVGLTSGSIVANPGGVGAGQIGNGMYINNVLTVLDGSTYVGGLLDGAGWVQVALVYGTGFTDDMAFFMNNIGAQGMPIDVALIEIFQSSLSQTQLIQLYNNRCMRFGLSPI